MGLATVEPVRPPVDDRRDDILDVVLELVEEHGYEAVQVRTVAERAHASLTTIYKLSTIDSTEGAAETMTTQPTTPTPPSIATTQPASTTASTAASTTTTTEPPATTQPAVVPTRSVVTSVDVESTTDHGPFDGLAYVIESGRIEGVVDPAEPVAGIANVALDEDGLSPYSAEFQIVRPLDGAETVVVEAVNRGNGLLRGLLGEDFLFGGGRAYATVAWQTERNPDVPAGAQGVGEVIVRDFGRLLIDGAIGGTPPPFGTFEHLVLAGWSQGAWFATTLVAEGFNQDPTDGSGVFDGVIAVSGVGSVLAINGFADDGQPQEPYIRPDAAPLNAGQILSRPTSDPLFVDIANYTDFYRLRAGLTSGADVDGYWRYDWPSAHAPGVIAPPAVVFDTFGCNGGVDIPTNPIDFRPYLRAVFVGMETELGASVDEAQRFVSGTGLPASAEFDLVTEQPAGTGELNDLPGATVPVPSVDEGSHPQGGVRFAESVVPLGSPVPVGIPPVTTASITDICGNFGGWLPRDPSDVLAQWPTVDDYLADLDPAIEELVTRRYLLPGDRTAMRSAAAAAYASAVDA
jgi:hypothetical protein